MELKVNDLVHDRYWPWRLGIVIRKLKTVVHVRWSGGDVWAYDMPHSKFLELDE
jgi:hypothetical protein